VVSNLTGIRGVAALWVFSLHYNEYFIGLIPGLSRFNFIFQNGRFGVDLFFCLSGFILGYVYFNELGYKFDSRKIIYFYYKRFARLYPIYVITFIVATIFYSIAISTGHEFNHESASNFSLSVIIQNFLGVQTWFGSNSLNGPAWSVSAEFAAYLLFPPLILLLHRRNKSLKILSLVSLLLSIYIYETRYQLFFLNHLLVRVLTEFTMGLCAYLLVKDLKVPAIICQMLRFFLTFMIVILLFFVHSEIILNSIIPLLLLTLITLNFFHNNSGKGLSRKSILNLGLWSYSLYMTHRLFQNIMSGLSLPLYDTNWAMKFLQLLLLLFVPIYTAFLATKYIENPARRFLLKLWT